MWIPYTDDVVVVRCNPLEPHDKVLVQGQRWRFLTAIVEYRLYILGVDTSHVLKPQVTPIAHETNNGKWLFGHSPTFADDCGKPLLRDRFSHFALARRLCLDGQPPTNRDARQAAGDGNATENPPGMIVAELA